MLSRLAVDGAAIGAGLDWKLLQEQERALVALLGDDEDNVLWGLVHMIGDIQDAGIASGLPEGVVYPLDPPYVEPE